MKDWRKQYRFHPSIIKWIDSINTHDQLRNAIITLPKFGENDIQQSCIRTYIFCKIHELTLQQMSTVFNRTKALS